MAAQLPQLVPEETSVSPPDTHAANPIERRTPIAGDRAAFERIAAYLAAGSGKWRAVNERHDSTNSRSPEALGLWFERTAAGHLLELTVVGYFDGQTRLGSRGFWYWKPNSEEIRYEEINPNGSVRTGVVEFTDTDTFTTLTDAFDAATGSLKKNRGENVMVSPSRHRTTAFALDDEGNWVVQQSLTWQLEPR